MATSQGQAWVIFQKLDHALNLIFPYLPFVALHLELQSCLPGQLLGLLNRISYQLCLSCVSRRLLGPPHPLGSRCYLDAGLGADVTLECSEISNRLICCLVEKGLSTF